MGHTYRYHGEDRPLVRSTRDWPGDGFLFAEKLQEKRRVPPRPLLKQQLRLAVGEMLVRGVHVHAQRPVLAHSTHLVPLQPRTKMR